ncbi:S-methyl-5-thioribose-1-phosphate isomerase [Ktedonospora formicarum]|uniref:Methylthioribose-1-phosphate isomerase n=1 Tax=Ktedonospora formicarum TaxID=2778364 RepID=A0A8J3MQX7_9CHLR|nr:S-methyl-5-thioribose-1-phosphate isomerase [Ktedonospora formicarum]GHO45342.1 methylthioribose-1-phosphate isomerase [Ktedonospora formicarum]
MQNFLPVLKEAPLNTLTQSQWQRTVWWEEDAQGAIVCLLDQSVLPLQMSVLRLRHEHEVAEAITSLRVRGAPAIGVTAAFGMALAAHRLWHEQGAESPLESAYRSLMQVEALLRATRPTAVNLFWALERMLACLHTAQEERVVETLPQLAHLLTQEALRIAEEDERSCEAMGRLGADLLQDGDSVLTHCNAGSLATAGIGTALAPFYIAHQQGKRLHVFVDETRPVLQGARLTAWELQRAGIPLTLITDNMAGYFMRQGKIKAVFVGADRVAANGDVANKIGTYSVAVLAHVHHIPFYVVAPCSTIDLALETGEQIPIEQRKPEEVTCIRGERIAPLDVPVANPAFDVTPHTYVTAIITDRGIARASYSTSLRQLLAPDA